MEGRIFDFRNLGGSKQKARKKETGFLLKTQSFVNLMRSQQREHPNAEDWAATG